MAHGAWQQSRGRQPSEPYLEFENPRKANQQANVDLALSGDDLGSLTEAVFNIPNRSGLARSLALSQHILLITKRAEIASVAKRNQTILEAHQEGLTMREIGKIIDKTPGRIHQIIAEVRS